MTTQVISSMHQDYISHVAFDIYGRRMATCSGDVRTKRLIIFVSYSRR